MTLPSLLGCQVCSAHEKQNVLKDKVFFGAKCASAVYMKYEINVQGYFELSFFEVKNMVRFRFFKIIKYDQIRWKSQ